MLEEAAMGNKIVLLPPSVPHLKIFVPETIVVVPVVHRNNWILIDNLAMIDLCIGLPIEVGHALLDLRLDLKLVNVHLVLQQVSSLSFTALILLSRHDFRLNGSGFVV